MVADKHTTVAGGPAHPAELTDLCALSCRIGRDIRLVQGGGGNTSLKQDNVLWIKASGTWLADAEARQIFLPLNLDGVHREIRARSIDPAQNQIIGQHLQRPSIEASLHALLPHRVVFHTHSVNAIAWAVQADGESLLADGLGTTNWAWVPYARPGLPLTLAVEAVLRTQAKTPDVLILANHGLVVGADNMAEMANRIETLERLIATLERQAPAAPSARLAELTGGAWRLPEDNAVHALALDADARAVAIGGVLYPDHVVFLGSSFCCLNGDAPLPPPQDVPFLIIEGAGVLVRDDLSPGALAMLSCLSLVARRLHPGMQLRYLNEQQIKDLVEWDAEAYRRALDRNCQPAT